MHTLDLLMNQSLIIVSFLIVAGLFIGVITLFTLPRLRRMKQRHTEESRRRAAEQAVLDRADRFVTEQEAQNGEIEELQSQTPVANSKVGTVAEAGVVPVQQVSAIAATKAALKLPTNAPTEPVKPEISAEQEDKPSSGMQDLLNSVFSDDEANERYQTLLQGSEPITAAELLEFAQEVSSKLRRSMSAAG